MSSKSAPLRPRVAIVQRAVRAYRVPFFEQLKTTLDERGIDLDLHTSNPPKRLDPRPDRADVSFAQSSNTRYFPIGKRTVVVWQPVFSRVRTADLVVVEHAAMNLVNYPLLAMAKMGRLKLAMWGHATGLGDDGTRVGAAIKRMTVQSPDWWFTYTASGAEKLAASGYDAGRITPVQNSTDTTDFRRLLAEVTEADRDRLMNDLGLDDGPVGAFVGSLSIRKGWDFMFESIDLIREQVPDFQFLIVGAGEMSDAIQPDVNKRDWVHHIPGAFGAELATILSVAKVGLVPRWAGLVLVDLLVAGCVPAIAAGLEHPPEASYVIDGVNGLAPDTDTPRGYADAVARVLLDEGEYTRLRKGAIAAGEDFTIEAMATRFADGIEQALAS